MTTTKNTINLQFNNDYVSAPTVFLFFNDVINLIYAKKIAFHC